MSEVIGRVVALWRFPVKSMAGERLTQVELGWRGIKGDRQYGFHFAGSASRFPWFTGRDVSDMVRYRACFRDPADLKGSPIDVTAPDGECFGLDTPELRARLSAGGGAPVALMQCGRGLFDAMPVSLVTTALQAALDEASGAPVDPRRFRINIVIDSDLRGEQWGERLLAFGAEDGPRLLVQEPIARCVMVTIDPDTATRTPAVLKTVVQRFGNRFGMYASPARTGLIHEGDVVRLL